jgi:hypothetical protein
LELYDQTGHTLLRHMVQCRRPTWFDPDTITVIQENPTSHPCLKQWSDLCQHIARVILSVGPWLKRTSPLRLRWETYQTADRMSLIYHWHLGQY